MPRWVNNLAGLGDIALKVRPAGNPDWRRIEATAGAGDPDEVQIACLARACLVDWQNVVMDGEPLPFTVEAAHTLLSDPALIEFRLGAAHAAFVAASLDEEEFTADADLLGDAVRWNLVWGDRTEFLRDLLADGEAPRALLDQPEVPNRLLFAWRAFWELNTERSIGMAIGPIPWRSIGAYAEKFSLADVDSFEVFGGLIRAMDRAYLKFTREQEAARDGPRKSQN